MMAADPPPPVIVQSDDQLKGLFAGLPCFESAGAKRCVFSISITGSKESTDAAKAKLAEEGWPSTYRTDRSGKAFLDVDPANKSLEATQKLGRRLASAEFGPVEAELVSLPVPGAK